MMNTSSSLHLFNFIIHSLLGQMNRVYINTQSTLPGIIIVIKIGTRELTAHCQTAHSDCPQNCPQNCPPNFFRVGSFRSTLPTTMASPEDAVDREMGALRTELSALSESRSVHVSTPSSAPFSPGFAAGLKSALIDAHIDWLVAFPFSVALHARYYTKLLALTHDTLIGVELALLLCLTDFAVGENERAKCAEVARSRLEVSKCARFLTCSFPRSG
jgi:hypothetical protein